MIRYLIWDAGGTLFDTYPAVVAACHEALENFGEQAPSPWVLSLCRKTTAHGIQTLAETFRLDEETFERHFRKTYADMDPACQPPFPGVRELCAYVREIGGQNFIVTHRSEASLVALLEAHAMTHYFTDWITKDDPYPRKPDPTSIKAIIARHDLGPRRCLAVGDRELDIVAGQRAGVHTCFFGRAPHPTPADVEVDDLAGLKTWLVEQNAAARTEARR
jgi:phosphoglycolate phosphatase-like HAD superfamily hydrolase